MFSQRHSQEARGSFTEPPKTERMRKLDSVVHPVFDNKFNSSLPKVPRIKNNLTVNTFHVTVEPVTAKMGTLEKPDQSLNLVTLPIWELKLADGPNLENLQNADLPIVEKASSWILKLPKDSLKKIKINETKPNISKKEFLEQKHKLKYSTFLQDDLIKTETSRSKLQRCTVKQDERKDNRLNLKVEKERSDKSVQFPSASGDRSSSLAEDSDECIMKLYICKKGRTKKSKNVTKNEESEEYLNKVLQ